QEDIKFNGHAIEARITAEDPYSGFLPSTGTVTNLAEPTGPGVRVESGLYEGCEISLFYDPMVAKLVVSGETRGDALLRLRRALQEYRILGIKTNIPFHLCLLENTNFIGGVYDTSFLADNPDLMNGFQSRNQAAAAIAATILFHHRRQQALVYTARDEQPSAWKSAARREALRY